MAKNAGRIWECIFYPESTDFDRLCSAIESLHVRAAVSPLHDSDTFDEFDVRDWYKRHKDADAKTLENAPKVGDKKKPHWHVLLCFKGTKRRNQIEDFCSDATDCGVMSRVVSDAGGYLRYFCHLDSPEKAQYNVSDITAFGGIDLKPLYEVSRMQSLDCIGSIVGFVNDNDIVHFCDLVEAAFESGDNVFIQTVLENSYFIERFISSRRSKKASN